LLCLATLVSAGVKVTHIKGPKKCKRKSRKEDEITVHYTGKIDQSSKTGEKGKVFETSRGKDEEGKDKEPYVFELGSATAIEGYTIKGWEKGLLGLCKGAHIELVVSPDYGYGKKGQGDVPGGATLHFEIEVLDFEPAEHTKHNLFDQIDGVKCKKLKKRCKKRKGKKCKRRPKPDCKRDGYLTLDEFASFIRAAAKVDKKVQSSKKSNYTKNVRGRARQMVLREDKDGDLRVSWKEFSGPKGDKPPKIEL